MSSAGTVNGRGFVISYSVTSNASISNYAIGGYTVTVDSSNVASCIPARNESTKTATGSHLFFTSKIALAFSTGTNSSYSATGSGSMKYILGS